MTVKIFMTDIGYIIGEVTDEMENDFYLENPGLVQLVETESGNDFAITEMIPPIMENKDELEKRFPLRKSSVAYSGPARADMVVKHKKYSALLVKKRSGIEVVGSGALNKLKELGGKLIK